MMKIEESSVRIFPADSVSPVCGDTALILAAGGSATRFGGGNKLLQPLDGTPLFTHCIRTLAPLLAEGSIFIAVPEASRSEFESAASDCLPGLRLCFVNGGKTRSESVLNALYAARTNPQFRFFAIHDAARPFLRAELFERCVRECRENGAAMLCRKICDTVKMADPENRVVLKTIPRDCLWAAETPQIFQRDILLSAYEAAGAEASNYTDDAQLLEHFSSVRMRIVENRFDNRKITYREDLCPDA